MEIPILLETRQYLVLNKPYGLNVERLPHGFPSVEEWVEQYQIRSGIKKPYTGIVHRLDRPVSGVLIVAKKKMALKILNEQFRERQVQKHYLARVEGQPPKQQDKLIHWIEKDQLHKKSLAYDQAVKNATKSTLHYQVLSTDGPTSLLQIVPVTGKFHQIRVQLATIGCPIVGDEKYGATTQYQTDGIALHARQVSFVDPIDQRKVVVEAPAPSAMNIGVV